MTNNSVFVADEVVLYSLKATSVNRREMIFPGVVLLLHNHLHLRCYVNRLHYKKRK